MPAVLEDAEQNLTPRLRRLLDRLWQEWKQTEIDIEASATRSSASATRMHAASACGRSPALARWSPPPPWPPSATALPFAKDASSQPGLGLVPRQHSTGGKQKLYGISKRGNIYLRRMFIHGARAVLLRVKYDTGGFGQWVHQLEQRAPRNKVIVAVANKLARIAWAVLSSGKDYRHQPLQHGGRLTAVEKTLRLESTKRFPLSHRHDDES